MIEEALIEQINALMIDIRNATGDNQYALDVDNGANCNGILQLNRGIDRPLSPYLAIKDMLLYLTAFDAGIHAGYLAAKRGN